VRERERERERERDREREKKREERERGEREKERRERERGRERGRERETSPGCTWEFANVKQLFWQCFDAMAIATQGLVNAKYLGSRILPCAYPAQRGIGAGCYCLTS
jgi:hypothetical protein